MVDDERRGLARLGLTVTRYQHNLTVRLAELQGDAVGTMQDEGLAGLVEAWLSKVDHAVTGQAQAVAERKARILVLRR